eukprot:747775-Hanusia_phi.AAC.4
MHSGRTSTSRTFNESPVTMRLHCEGVCGGEGVGKGGRRSGLTGAESVGRIESAACASLSCQPAETLQL